MTQEEKARAYDEALERARKQRDEYQEEFDKTDKNSKLASILRSAISAVELAFPELVESEDEKNWKAVMEYVKDDALRSWLEKQKENNEYVFRPLAGTDVTIAAEQAIKRAKEGDRLVLAFNGFYTPVTKHDSVKRIVNEYDSFIEKPKEQKHYWKPTETDVALFNKAVTTNNTLTPAERANLDIIRSKFGCCRATNCSGIVQKEQKPTDDEAFEKWIDDWYQGSKEAGGDIMMNEAEFKNWSRGIKNMYQQKSVEWSKEDEYNLAWIVETLLGLDGDRSYSDTCKKMSKWVKSLPEKFVLQPKQEWDTHDKAIVNCIVCCLDGQFVSEAARKQSLEWFNKHRRDFLNSTSWKPSEEQMKALYDACCIAFEEERCFHPSLSRLYHDLRKL